MEFIIGCIFGFICGVVFVFLAAVFWVYGEAKGRETRTKRSKKFDNDI